MRFLLLAALLLAQGAGAAQTGSALATRGRDAVPACDGCHTASRAIDAQPLLAAQPAQYLYAQLVRYANGGRVDARMNAIASALSDVERREVSEYYASLASERTSAAISATQRTLGRRIALEGTGSQPVPACIKCHGQRGEGIAPHVPRLAGQRAQYIARELDAWRNQQRSGDTDGVMSAVASRMNDADVAAVAAYYAAAP